MKNKIVKFKNELGFSLIELMFVVGIFTVITLGVFTILIRTQDEGEISQARMLLQEDIFRALNEMAAELNQTGSGRITVAGDGNSVSFTAVDPNNAIDTGNNYEIDWSSGHSITYSLSSTQLIRTDADSGDSTVLANNITDFDVVGDATPPEAITLTLYGQKTTLEGRTIPDTPMEFSKQVIIRND